MAHGAQRRQTIDQLLNTAVVGQPVNATGWVKTSRFSKNVSFVHLSDAQEHGGEAYAYRLRIGPPRPDFAVIRTPSSLVSLVRV